MPNNNNLQMLHAVESERIVIQCSDQIIWNNAHTNGTKYHENHSFILISLKKKNSNSESVLSPQPYKLLFE